MPLAEGQDETLVHRKNSIDAREEDYLLLHRRPYCQTHLRDREPESSYVQPGLGSFSGRVSSETADRPW